MIDVPEVTVSIMPAGGLIVQEKTVLAVVAERFTWLMLIPEQTVCDGRLLKYGVGFTTTWNVSRRPGQPDADGVTT
jgi:hypothetical protein